MLVYRILDYLSGKSIPMNVTQCLPLIEDCDGNPDIMGDVYITMDGPRRHCFCVGLITCKEGKATGTGIFATKNHDYYLVAPACPLCRPWNGMEGDLVHLFCLTRNGMTLQYVKLEISEIPERPVGCDWHCISAAQHESSEID